MYEQKRHAREIKEAMDLVKSHQVTELFCIIIMAVNGMPAGFNLM